MTEEAAGTEDAVWSQHACLGLVGPGLELDRVEPGLDLGRLVSNVGEGIGVEGGPPLTAVTEGDVGQVTMFYRSHQTEVRRAPSPLNHHSPLCNCAPPFMGQAMWCLRI